jgi:hypothetical protein
MDVAICAPEKFASIYLVHADRHVSEALPCSAGLQPHHNLALDTFCGQRLPGSGYGPAVLESGPAQRRGDRTKRVPSRFLENSDGRT